MVKLSQAAVVKIGHALQTSSIALRKLAAERDALLEVLATKVEAEEVAKVKQAMVEKGINPWGDPDTRDAELSKIAQDGKLSTFSKAVELSADLSVAKIGSVLDESIPEDGKRSDASKRQLDAHILG
jgi:hypothetical protein